MGNPQSGWYFTEKELRKPIKRDGTDFESSNRYRWDLYKFVKNIGHKMNVPQITISTACVYLHRFYVRKDYMDYDVNGMGMTCFFLASKVEETHTRLKDVIGCGYYVMNKPNPTDAELKVIANKLLIYERILLQTLSFDLTIEHPYVHFLNYVSKLFPNDDRVGKEWKQIGWNYLNDSYGTAVCLQFQPRDISAAAIYLASAKLNKPVPDINGKPWYESLKFDIDLIEKIACQIRKGIERISKPDNIHSSRPPLPSSSKEQQKHTSQIQAASSATSDQQVGSHQQI